MNKRFFVSLMLVLAVLVTVFAPMQAQEFEAGSVLNVAWPYSVPPTGHFNTFASGNIALGQYQDIHEPPLVTLHSDNIRIFMNPHWQHCCGRVVNMKA